MSYQDSSTVVYKPGRAIFPIARLIVSIHASESMRLFFKDSINFIVIFDKAREYTENLMLDFGCIPKLRINSRFLETSAKYTT